MVWLKPWSMLVAAALTGGAGLSAAAQEAPISFGELNPYSRYAADTIPARNGWQLARDEINARGGILGRRLEIVSLDDGATPTDALRAAEQLVTRSNVSAIFGAYLSNVGLALGDFANRQKVPYVATFPIADALTMKNGNPYTFRLRPNLHMQIEMLGEELIKLGPKRWALVVPNYEFGYSAVAAFKRVLQERVPGSTIVLEQYPAVGKIDSGALANAIEEAKPDGIFSGLFSADTTQFARDGQSRGLFENRTVISLATGEPEIMRSFGADTPEGWIVTGYPSDQISQPSSHKAFIDTYVAKYKEVPNSNSLLSYVTVYMLKAAVEKAGSPAPQAIATALRGLRFESVTGPVLVRAIDNQATFGYWIGKTTARAGKGTLRDWQYFDGEKYLYPEDEVRAVRKD